MKRSLFLGSAGAGIIAAGSPLLVPKTALASRMMRPLVYTPPDATFFRNVMASYFTGLALSVPVQPVCRPSENPTCEEQALQHNWAVMMNIFNGEDAGWTASMQLHMQELANIYNAKYPAGPAVKRTRLGIVPMDDATTIADAAAVIGGMAGVILSVTFGFPVLVGASAGILVVGAAAYCYAAANPGIKANDFDQAVADGAWQGSEIGAAGDLVTLLKIAELPVGLAPYGFISGGVLGAVKFWTHKYYPYIWAPGHVSKFGYGGGTVHPSYVAWSVAPYVSYHVSVTFTGTPCDKLGC